MTRDDLFKVKPPFKVVQHHVKCRDFVSWNLRVYMPFGFGVYTLRVSLELPRIIPEQMAKTNLDANVLMWEQPLCTRL